MKITFKLLFGSLVFFSITTYSQIQHSGTPISKNKILKSQVHTIKMPSIDVNALLIDFDQKMKQQQNIRIYLFDLGSLTKQILELPMLVLGIHLIMETKYGGLKFYLLMPNRST